VVFDSAAVVAPLDVFIMLDSSGSMNFSDVGDLPKWDIVRDAFQAFATDPDSAGLGVALSFFPIIDTSYQQTCTSLSNCEPNECKPFSVCAPSIGITCETNQDCVDGGFPNDTCEPYGLCNGSLSSPCVPTAGINCNPGQTCFPAGSCWSFYTCPSPPYQTPVFGVSKLPGAANGLVATINNHNPVGGTPTLPALQGAVDGALGWAATHPSHKVIVVLATDGLPTVCDQDIDGQDPLQPILNVANVAAAGQAQGVSTFVIGVFTQDEQMEAQVNLDTIAQAGAGQPAYVVTTGNNQSTDAFVQALNEIRLNAKSCEFELVQDGDPIDFESVWVRIVTGMTEHWVPRVDGPQQCGDGLGFYYDVAPNQGPSRIILCPAACALVDEAEENPSIEVFTSCPDPMGQGGN
ncbi:MAG: hypothetical protein KC731_35315, partial [Myxococcales bacterium]|nr:hypothetical protein [Myxococcales bacterium]